MILMKYQMALQNLIFEQQKNISSRSFEAERGAQEKGTI